MLKSRLVITTLLLGAVGVAIATNAFAANSPDRARSAINPSVPQFTAINGLHHPAPKSLASALDSPYYAEHFAPDVSAARLVSGTLSSRDQVWLIPGRDAVCLYLKHDESSGASCQPDRDAAAGRLILSVSPRDASEGLVAGVLPDGISTVDLVGHAARTVAVEANVYSATTDADMTSFTDAQGLSQQVTIPRASK